MISNRKKIIAIKSGRELYRVESRYKKPSLFAKYLLKISVYLIFFLYVILIQLLINEISEKFIFIVISIIFLSLAIAVMNLSFRSRGYPFIITEKGVFVDPYTAEFWEDIEGYKWDSFNGFMSTSFNDKGAGTSLRIVNKGIFQRNLLGSFLSAGRSALPMRGIFFTNEQIQETEKIFRVYGINKIEDY